MRKKQSAEEREQCLILASKELEIYQHRYQKVRRRLEKKGVTFSYELNGFYYGLTTGLQTPLDIPHYWVYDAETDKLYYTNLKGPWITIHHFNLNKLRKYDVVMDETTTCLTLRFYGAKFASAIYCFSLGMLPDILEDYVVKNKEQQKQVAAAPALEPACEEVCQDACEEVNEEENDPNEIVIE